ncbi:MAG: hypothetical protein WD080_07485 [Egibacteraceae bacterium]
MARLPRAWPVPVLVAAALAALLAAASTALAADVMLGPGGFEPQTVTVDPGEEIVWVNDSAAPQTIIGEDGSWDSGPLAAGETFSVALRTAGTVAYGTDDGAHLGRIEVRAAAPPAASPPASDVHGEQVVAMPRTGGPLRPAGLLAVALLAAGGACLLAAPRPGGPTA